MTLLNRLASVARWILRRDKAEADLDDDLHSFVEMAASERVRDGVVNAEGAAIAEAAGLSVVMDRCIKVEHARYAGRMHWLGFNTHRITSIRGGLQ